MAKNIEINILTDDTNKTYEILYPKVDLTNNQGTALPIDSTSGSIDINNRTIGNLDIINRTTGNLPSSRLSGIISESLLPSKIAKYEVLTYTGTANFDNISSTTLQYGAVTTNLTPLLVYIDKGILFFPELKVQQTDNEVGMYVKANTGTLLGLLNPNKTSWKITTKSQTVSNYTEITESIEIRKVGQQLRFIVEAYNVNTSQTTYLATFNFGTYTCLIIGY